MEKNKIKVSELVFKYLVSQGVQDVFLLPGGGCMHLVDSLGKTKEIKYTCFLHEQGATIAAAAYAQYKNDLGVALVTTGPGGTNAITAVAAAWVESIPLLIISGQVKSADLRGDEGPRMKGMQEIDIVSLVRPITKYALTIKDPSSVIFHLQKAIRTAKSDRPGPVWLDFPLDVQAETVNNNLKNYLTARKIKSNTSQDILQSKKNNDSEKCIQLLNASKRPIILAGNGIITSGEKAKELFYQLISYLKIPVLTTWKAAALLSDNNQLFYGRPGVIAKRSANFIQQNADLIISLGARLDFGQIGYHTQEFAKNAKKVIVDIDNKELEKFNFKVELLVNADVKHFMQALYKNKNSIKVKEKSSNDWKEWVSKCTLWKEKYSKVGPECISTNDSPGNRVRKSNHSLRNNRENNKYVSTYRLVEVLSKLSSVKDIFVPGSSGACSEIFFQAYRIKEKQLVLNMPNWGAMGLGLPSSIGVSIASGSKRKIICINGDGGFQLNIQELEVIRRLALPIKFFILDNEGYGSIRNTQKNYFDGHLVASNPGSGLTLPDICKLAKAYQIRQLTIKKDDKLLIEKIREVLKGNDPVICKVSTPPNELTIPRLSSYFDKEGKLCSPSLENLWPPLEVVL